MRISIIDALIVASFLAAGLVLLRKRRPRRWAWGLAGCVVLLAAYRSEVWIRKTYAHDLRTAELNRSVPDRQRHEGYVSSQTCRSCHPSEFQSWHATYHRTMTQLASPAAVLGDFSDVQLTREGRRILLTRRGDEFWAISGADDASGGREETRTRIVMTTGSHHYQVYWGSFGTQRRLTSLPFVYLLEARRWIPREDVFLTPPVAGPHVSHWSSNCVGCHSTYGILKEDGSRTLVAELGIACEGCHGPAGRHVEVNRSPLRRYWHHLTKRADSTIINPARLPADRSSTICGQCHSAFFYVEGAGHRYRVGGDLAAVRAVVRPKDPAFRDHLAKIVDRKPGYLKNSFWSDGMIRVAGRDYNGMIESKCYRGGRLSCVLCHSMHASDPNDQLARGMEGDGACLQCHETYRSRVETHTHHRAGSSGSSCYNCHMPYTTYGLLKAIRSHLIDFPKAQASVETGRPNACNQCHMDKSLGWTQRYLTEWYGMRPVELSGEEAGVSQVVLHMLKGDAGQRALAAWAMGWEPAKRVSGEGWEAPFLAGLLDDPYAAVRYIAYRSLRALPGFGGFEYDYVGPPRERSDSVRRARRIWETKGPARLDRKGSEILVGPSGGLEWESVKRLFEQRDDRPIQLME